MSGSVLMGGSCLLLINDLRAVGRVVPGQSPNAAGSLEFKDMEEWFLYLCISTKTQTRRESVWIVISVPPPTYRRDDMPGGFTRDISCRGASCEASIASNVL